MAASRADRWREITGGIALSTAALGTFGNALHAFGVEGSVIDAVRYGIGVIFILAFVIWAPFWLRHRWASRR